jgi:hypothetical protein
MGRGGGGTGRPGTEGVACWVAAGGGGAAEGAAEGGRGALGPVGRGAIGACRAVITGENGIAGGRGGVA